MHRAAAVATSVRRAVAVTGALVLAAACSSMPPAPTQESLRPSSTVDVPGENSDATDAAEVAHAEGGLEMDAVSCASISTAASKRTSHRLVSSGNEYEYLLYVPPSSWAPVPLVLNFHGLGGNGADHAAFTEYELLAEFEGFAVAHPSGLVVRNSGGIRNWESASGVDGRDDTQMTRDLIDRVADQACIDTSRVYVTGFSNGGYFSAHLVCELADRVAAAFSVAAISFPEGCAPARPVAMGAIHGTDDRVVPFDGSGKSLLLGDGVESLGSDKSVDTAKSVDNTKESRVRDLFRLVMPDELAKFAAAFGCAIVTESEVGVDTTLTRHTDCEGGVELRFYAVEGGGHDWPGTSWAKAGAQGADRTPAVSATADGWAFMSQYSLGTSNR